MNKPTSIGLYLTGIVMVAFLLVAYFNLTALLAPWVVLPAPADITTAFTLATMLFSLCHAAAILRWRNALTFFGLSTVISWSFEEIGVRTGMIYGAYHYTELLGPKLGNVPLLIPLAWFMMIYPSYIIANLIIDGDIRPTQWTIRRMLWRALAAGMVMTAWDLVIDPGMSAPGGAWVWEQGGPYFGVPLQNFAGWLLTTITVYFCYGLWERQSRLQDAPAVPQWFGSLPPVVYGMITFRYIIENEQGVLGVVALFAMGFPCLMAIWRHFDRDRSRPSSTSYIDAKTIEQGIYQ